MADIVGNYLSNYYTAQDRGQQQAQQQMQNQRQAVADQRSTTQFDQTNQLNQINLHKAKVSALNDLLSRVPDGNAQAFEAAKTQALQHPELGLKPEDVANLTVADLPRLKMETGQTQAMLDLKLKELQTKQMGAQIGLLSAQTDAARANADFVRSGKGQFGRPMSGSLQGKETELLQNVQTAGNNNADVNLYLGKIRTGELDPGLLKNNYDKAKSFFGFVDPADQNAIAYNNFISDMTRLQNESLRLNKGVQTEGDAQRAWKELFANLNDKTIVASRLERIAKLNARAAQQNAALVRNQRRNFFGKDYQEPNWQELGIDPSLIAPPQNTGNSNPPSTAGWSTKRVK